jgi:hypothetical protein
MLTKEELNWEISESEGKDVGSGLCVIEGERDDPGDQWEWKGKCGHSLGKNPKGF